MKKLYITVLSLAILAVVLSGMYYVSQSARLGRKLVQISEANSGSSVDERNKAECVGEEGAVTGSEMEKVLSGRSEQSELDGQKMQEQDQISIAAVTANMERLLFSAKVTVIEYDAFSNTTSLKTEELNKDWIGMNRSELIGWLSEYEKHPSLEEGRRGLTGIELLEFSKDKVKLRRQYDRRLVKNQFIATIEDGMVVIYYSDRKTVYEYTGIDRNSLTVKEQETLEKGIEIRDEEQLYGLLEAYSS